MESPLAVVVDTEASHAIVLTADYIVKKHGVNESWLEITSCSA